MMKLKNIRIRTRLTGGFCVFMLVTVMFSIPVILSLKNIEKGILSGLGTTTWLFLSIIAVI